MSLAPLLVLLTCLIASVSYVGAVTESALATLVLPTVLLVGLLAVRLRSRPGPAMVAVLLVSCALGEVVNVASGQFEGSVARSAGVAALATGVAVVLGASRRPALFLLPVAVIVAWALALGAGARVQLVAVVTSGIALVALAAVERELRLFVKAPRMAGSVLLALLLVVGAGVIVAQYQLHHDNRPAASPFRQTLATTIEPPKIFSLTRHPPPSATKAIPARSALRPIAASHHQRVHQLVPGLLWVLLALAVGLLLGLLSRLLWVSFAWRRLRRQLQRGVGSTEAGAWAWTVASLGRLGSPVAVFASPDVACEPEMGLPEPVRVLARMVTPAVFAPRPVAVSSDVWLQAGAAVDDAWESAGLVRRTRARWRTPGSTAHAH